MKKYALKIDLPNEVLSVISSLEKNGFEAYAAGGAVRDFLMMRPVSDYDVTTNATPEEVHRIFKKCFDTGIKHGTVTVLTENFCVEVTTYRLDGEYSNHRFPKSVSFSKKLEDDLSRRDFTVNSLVYNPKCGILDYFDGVEDIKNKKIKAVGNSSLRFCEDALRIVRAVRFACTLGFEIEDETFSAMYENAKFLSAISRERIRDEFTKLLFAKNLKPLKIACEKGIFDGTFPNVKSIENFDVVENAPDDFCVKWALFIYLMGKEYADEVLKNLKFSNNEKKIVRFLINNVDFNFNCSDAVLKKFIAAGEGMLEMFEKFMNSLGKYYPSEKINKILSSGEAYKINMLTIGGKEAASVAKRSEDIGKILKFCLEYVIENPAENSYEKLIERAKMFYEN